MGVALYLLFVGSPPFAVQMGEEVCDLWLPPDWWCPVLAVCCADGER